MEERNSQSDGKNGFVLKTGWPHWMLSATIIASRACRSSFPMEEWSWWSWLLMLAPIAFPLYMFAAWYAGAAAAACVSSVAGLFSKRRRDY